MTAPLRFQCPELHGGLPAPAYGIHSRRPGFIAAAVDRRACQHITPEERAELKAGRVPARLAVADDE